MKKQSKKRIIAFLLSTLMLLSLFQNISYYPSAEGGEEPAAGVEVDGDVASGSDADLQAGESAVQSISLPAEQEQVYLSAGEPEQDVLAEDTQTVQADETKDLLADANVTLRDITLKGVYRDEAGVSHVVTFDKNSTISLPGNADINMYLDFSLVDGNSVTAGTKYVYTLPDTVRVDVEKTHELKDSNGDSIGQVHISRDGTLTFEFNTDVVRNNVNIPFYVQFDGKFSESLSNGGQSASISFPAGGATIDYNVDITEPTSTDPSESNLDYEVYKSGSATTVTDNGVQKKAIHWSVEVNPRGRKPFSGTLTDLIPEGLTYVEGSCRATDYYEGTVTPTYADGILSVDMQDCKSFYTIKVEFDTYVTPNYGTGINNNTSVTQSNTASFKPANTQDKQVSSNAATVTLKPDVLSKTGVNNGGVITWTVEINKEGLDLNGADYTDVFGEGQDLVTTYGTDGFQFETGSQVATINKTTDAEGKVTGFTIDFGDTTNNGYYKFTYQTQQANWAQSSFTNEGKVNDGKFSNYTQIATVPGISLIQKTSNSYDEIMHTLTWTITVNPDKRDDLGATTITDTFPQLVLASWEGGTSHETMDLVSVTLDDGTVLPDSIKTTNGFAYTFPADAVNGRARTLTVVTKVKDELVNQFNGQWKTIKNKVALTSSLNPSTPATAEAERTIQLKKTELGEKTGKIQKDGTIAWTIKVNASTLKKEKITIEDTLSNNQQYIPGSAVIVANEWQLDQNYDLRSREPSVSGQVLTFTFDSSDDLFASGFFNNAFYIRYYTKANTTDVSVANSETTYENEVNIAVDYEGDIHLEDNKNASVTGVVGGVIDKKANYVGNNDYVDWSVVINKPGYDLSAAQNPCIQDTLASYYDYEGGTLYEVGSNGSETEVSASAYIVTVVNRVLTVQLPTDENGKYLGTKSYVFKFRTRFNCLQAELEQMGELTNSVSFIGLGSVYSVTSESLKNVHFSSSSAGSHINHRIRIRKVDSANNNTVLQGAVFEMYAGNVLIASAETDAQGYAVFDELSISEATIVKIKEITPPDGYNLPDNPVTDVPVSFTSVEIVDGMKTIDKVIENTKMTVAVPTGTIEITKKDAADTTVLLPGAEFTLYNNLPLSETTKVATRTTDANGKVTFASLDAGDGLTPKKYYVVETNSPEGYLYNSATPVVVQATISRDSTTATTTYAQGTVSGSSFTSSGVTEPAVVKNTKATAKLVISKIKKNDDATKLSGAIFSIYKDAQCTDLVDTQTTDSNGNLTFSNLELGKTYYYREEVAPGGYEIDNTVYPITIGTGSERAIVTKAVTVENEEQLGSLKVKKVDDSVPANAIAGIQFRLHKDTENGPIVQYTPAGTSTSIDYVVTTDTNGEALFENLPYGTYYVEEIASSVPVKYEASSLKKVIISSSGITDVTVVNTIKKFTISIVKVDEADHNVTLAGAKFSLYTNAGILVDEKVTGSDGKVEFTNLPYEGYYITEVTAPEGYNKSGRITIPVSNLTDTSTNGSNYTWNANTKTYSLIVTNKKQNGQIIVTKYEKGNPNDVPLAGAEFTLYKDGIKIGTKTSDADGKVEFTGLPYGTYTLKETKAPDVLGKTYIMDSTTYTIEVVSDTINKINGEEKDSSLSLYNVVNDVQITTPPNISFKLLKQAKDSVNNVTPGLEGATFGFYEIKSDATEKLLATATSDADGMVYFRQVNIENCNDDSKFVIRELTVPDGYQKVAGATDIVLGNKKLDLNAYADVPSNGGTGKSDAEILWMIDKSTATPAPSNAIVVNDKIYGSLLVTKLSSYDNSVLAGAEFTLYEADGVNVVSIQTTDENGIATFTNLPVGRYVVKETGAPKGYILNTEAQNVTITDTTAVTKTFRDDRIDVSISKMAIGGSAEITGAHLTLTDSASNVVDDWYSSTTPHKILYSKLEVGKVYTLTETAAPNGYAYSESVQFKITDSGAIEIQSGSDADASVSGQTLVMRDGVMNIQVLKQNNQATPQPLANATLAILEVRNGVEVELERFTSGTTAHRLNMNKISAPAIAGAKKEYILREIAAPNGYEIAADIYFAVDRDGKVWTQDINGAYVVGGTQTAIITMTDKEKPNGTIYVRKLNADSGEALAGAMLAIYKATDNINDPSVYPVIAQFETGAAPKAIQVTDAGGNGILKAGEKYKLVETQAPTGYVIAEPIIFTVTKGTDNKFTITQISDSNSLNSDKVTMMMRDKRLSLTIRKETSSGDLLAGARLALYEGLAVNETKLIKRFDTNSTNAQTIEFTKLKANQEYLLVEEAAPNGFKLSGNIKFTIGADGKIEKQFLQKTDENGTVSWVESRVYGNTVIMTDDEEAVTILKIDAGNNQKLAGSTLRLESIRYAGYGNSGYDSTFTPITVVSTEDGIPLDAKKFHTGCVYRLTEIDAPDGYAFTDPVVFEFTAEHQIRYLGDNTFVDQTRTVYIRDGRINLTIDKRNPYSHAYVSNAKLQILDASGAVVTEWTSDGTGKEIGSLLSAGNGTSMEYYVLHEVQAPTGYSRADDIPFAIDRDGKIYTQNTRGDYTEEVANGIITMYDEPQLQISKEDMAGSEVVGATLTITKDGDNTFNPITWTSGPLPQVIDCSRLEVGVTYTLTETNAPNGYAYAESISFKLMQDGTILVNGEPAANHTIVMKDELVKVNFSKQDATNGEELPGAQIVIQDEAGNVLSTFTSTTTPTVLSGDMFKVPTEEGKLAYYTLTEITAPFGYDVAESIRFALDRKGQVYVENPEGEGFVLLSSLDKDVIIMQDAPKYATFSKVDATNGNELPGARLEIKDADGNMIDSWVSTNEKHQILMHKFKPDVVYSMTEITAPKGYEVAETIYFKLDADGKVYVKTGESAFTLLEDGVLVMKDAPSTEVTTPDTPTDTATNTSAKTGDTAPIAFVFALSVLAFAGIMILRRWKKREE